MDYATVAYNASSGAHVWTRRYNGLGNGSDLANAIGVSPDGQEVFVTGESTGSTTSLDYATLGYNAATGAHVWTRRYNGPGDGSDIANALAVSSDGTHVIVTGESSGSTSGTDWATIAYAA